MKVVGRYVLVEFLRVFGLCMVAFLMIYVLVDVFDRMEGFLKYHATFGEVLRYLFFKIPLIVTQLVPVATLASVLIALGTMARHNELTALRASGVSTMQVATPLFAIATALSVAILAWNETVVPYSTERSRYIEIVEIRNRPLKALLSEDGIWFHGRNGIYNIEHFDSRTGTLVGLTVYDLNADFTLRRLVQIPTAQWKDDRWIISTAIERTFDDGTGITTRTMAPDEFALPERPQDFQMIEKDPEELNFRRLQHHIRELSRKGIDTTESRVDLHLKLALPLVPLVMVLVGVPLAGRNPRRRPLATSIGIGLVVGFSYWVLLALTISLGHGGAIPPAIAAWSANGVFTLLGAFLFLGPE
ncbi:MAG: LPS export ABC transporter permease LptG [Deltaproteobacteria bacterium]|nr:LPS export ABC transporter permease LptG [Deltaproteobacteria bacterium]